MKLMIFFVLLLQSGLMYASGNIPLDEVLKCRHSVFYGEVINGSFTKSKPEVVPSELVGGGYGSYKVRVLENIAGEKYFNQVTVQSDYPAILQDGLSLIYPAPGRKYIFIVVKNGRGLKFSPYYSPEVGILAEHNAVIDAQHAFVDGLEYFYKDENGLLKESAITSDVTANNFLGYTVDSYIRYIAKEFGLCTIEK